MKKPLPMPLIAAAAALAAIVLVFLLVRASGDPAPTATNVPDYSKMTPQEVSAAYAKSKAAEKEALSGKR